MRSGVPRRMLLHGGLSCWKGRRERESEGGIRASKGGYEEKERPGQREDQATAPCERSLNLALGRLAHSWPDAPAPFGPFVVPLLLCRPQSSSFASFDPRFLPRLPGWLFFMKIFTD